MNALPFYEAEAKKQQRLSKGRGVKGEAKMPQVKRAPQARDRAAKDFGVSGRTSG